MTPNVLEGLEVDQRIRVELPGGKVLVGRLQEPPETVPPMTPMERARGWDQRTNLPAVYLADPDGTEYETLNLSQEQRDGEWGEVSATAWYYTGGEYVHDNHERVEVDPRD